MADWGDIFSGVVDIWQGQTPPAAAGFGPGPTGIPTIAGPAPTAGPPVAMSTTGGGEVLQPQPREMVLQVPTAAS